MPLHKAPTSPAQRTGCLHHPSIASRSFTRQVKVPDTDTAKTEGLMTTITNAGSSLSGVQGWISSDLFWVYKSAILDDSFHNFDNDFPSSLGSNHMCLWVALLTLHPTQGAQNDPGPPYIIQDAACQLWIENFKMDLQTPSLTTDRRVIDRIADKLTQHIENTLIATSQPIHNKPWRCAHW